MLTSRYQDALAYALEAHTGDTRKGSSVPYFSHLLSVSALALEHGADEDAAIAALLHDVVEDHGGRERLEDVRVRFGEVVASVVLQCSDTVELVKEPWRVRKTRYLAQIPKKTPRALLVTSADKLHNARCLLLDFRAQGPQTFDRFNAGRTETLWYYGALAGALSAAAAAPERLVGELGRVVSELVGLAGS